MAHNPVSTRVFCPHCQVVHPATYIEQDNQLFLLSECPHGQRRTRVSSDARLFQHFRDCSIPVPEGTKILTHNHILHISDKCSMKCPVCFADSGERPWVMSLEDLRFRAAAIRRDRGYFVTLSGGEPTEHPEILKIVRILHHEFKLKVSILSNGIRLGQEANFAFQLKKAGLRKAVISFETFRPEISQLMRGGNYIKIKQQALQNCWDAGLNTAISATICKENLPEVGQLLRYSLENTPKISLLLLQPLQRSGRIPDSLNCVDREEILKQLAISGVIEGLKAEDFFPMPMAPGFGLCVHPDCGAMQVATVTAATKKQNFQVELLEKNFPVHRFLQRLALEPFGSRRVGQLRFVWLLLRTGGWRLLKYVWRWVYGGGRNGILIFGVDNLMNSDRLDCQRLATCATRRCEKDGSMNSVCFHYSCYAGIPEDKK